ncbi:MAG: hypothetical protein CMB80_21675 [Flammeovirgaceae bacterium]|nr:hypothetical protein [Flammeovirgaceae bacterium]MBE62677.1 hypothetical protein [Flammeovirgaceae bacterium]MBR11321.1 hypothetical protein [Rickettsiales bacterium]HCX21567.1 hypothetical protein [Cytophagales bacterium]
MKASVLIVEDEALIADDIASILEKNGYSVTDIVDNSADALESIAQSKPDVALLDINIKGDHDGIELAPKLDVPFVFLTSYYDQNTINRAKLVNPSGYIVKPFAEKDLIVNVELAFRKKTLIKPTANSPVKLFVRKDQEIVALNSDKIIFAEAFDNYTYVYSETDKYMISHTLKSVEEKLSQLGFIRVHRSFLINFQAIDNIQDNTIFLKGHKVLIGKSYRKDFFNQLELL